MATGNSCPTKKLNNQNQLIRWFSCHDPFRSVLCPGGQLTDRYSNGPDKKREIWMSFSLFLLSIVNLHHRWC